MSRRNRQHGYNDGFFCLPFFVCLSSDVYTENCRAILHQIVGRCSRCVYCADSSRTRHRAGDSDWFAISLTRVAALQLRFPVRALTLAFRSSNVADDEVKIFANIDRVRALNERLLNGLVERRAAEDPNATVGGPLDNMRLETPVA